MAGGLWLGRDPLPEATAHPVGSPGSLRVDRPVLPWPPGHLARTWQVELPQHPFELAERPRHSLEGLVLLSILGNEEGHSKALHSQSHLPFIACFQLP